MNKPTLLRTIRLLMAGALGVILGLLTLLCAMDVAPGVIVGDEITWRTVEVIPFAAWLMAMVGALLAVRALRNVSGVISGTGCIIAVALLIGVTLDDAEFARPLRLEEFSPSVPGGDESWELSVRDWSQASLNAASASADAARVTVSFAAEPEKFAAELAAKRDKIELGWAKLNDERDWLARLNAFPEIGDATPARLDAPRVKFQVVRAVTQVACARAALLALEGRGDEAADTLLPVIEVSRKLEPSARSLVRAMIARVMLGTTLDTLRFVLTCGEVSSERRAALAVALERGVGGTAGARRLMFIEYAMHFDGYFRLGVPPGTTAPRRGGRWQRWMLQPYFHPRATANLYAAHAEQMARLAEQRQWAKMEARENEFSVSLGGFQLKNPIGRGILMWAVPATQKVAESYWAHEDSRLAMIAELRKPR